MTLPAGTRLGPYEVISPIGAGGMGEVYRAKDPRLDRDVAIKVLPPRFSEDPELHARFEQEARAISRLNHPHVCALYDVGSESGTDYIVMEYLEGETLADRLARGALPTDEALRVSTQILDALETAHAAGILHRDLKPSNVHLARDARVKLLDFGLAKSIAGSEGADASSRAQTAPGTRAGTLLGTPAYMSPEQARGQPLDKRTDLWSFGCVLFEMLAGRPAFQGNSTSDVLAAVLRNEPRWDALPRGTPPAVRHLLVRSLEKDAGRRLRDAGDARLEIEEALSTARDARRPRGLPVVAVLAVVLLLGGLVWLSRRDGPSQTRRSPAQLAQVTFAETVEEFPAWSRAGDLAYSGESQGVRKIFVQRAAGGADAAVTRGEFDEIHPAWSPDGRTLLLVRAKEPRSRLEPGDVFGSYGAGADVWALDVASGGERRLIQNAFNPAFSPDGRRIAVDASWVGAHRIWLTDGEGRNPVQLTSDTSEAVEHVGPRWSPDGKHVVFQNAERTKFDVRVAEVATQKLQWVTNDLSRDVRPVWSADGRSIWFSSDRGGGLNIWRVPVAPDGRPTGRLEQVTTGAGQDVNVAVSPAGGKVAFSILKQNANLWRMPVSPQTGEPDGPPAELIGTTREDSRGSWSPDGARIAFNSDRGGEMNIWIFRIADGSARQLTRGPGGDFQPFWSPDGKRVVFFSSRSGNADIWAADVDSGALTQLTRGRAIDVNPSFSPDGSRIAYQSDEGGRMEIWVMSSNGREPRQLTREGVAGGHFLRWTPAGDAVYYRCLCGDQPQMLKAAVDGGLVERLPEVSGGSHISFSPDHSRLLDVVGHKILWVSPLAGGSPRRVFEFEDPAIRIDYPVWSPDGNWVLFDRFRPQGGDIWVMSGVN